jgi:protein-tyrosine phosphatase
VLPDHRHDRLPDLAELQEALAMLESLRQHGPVYVHCVAAMERSPLVCLAWLVSRHGLRPQPALDYLMQVHPGTSPLPGQLALLHAINP